MPPSPLRLVKRIVEFVSRDRISELPQGLRGFYVLYQERQAGRRTTYDVLYVGMAAAGRGAGLRRRLASYAKSKRKKLWTHFSAFEVWDNIRNEEIAEIEGLFRHIYRKDPAANRLNIQRGFKKARRLPKIELGGLAPRIPRARADPGVASRRRR
jgi:hypothetical protein